MTSKSEKDVINDSFAEVARRASMKKYVLEHNMCDWRKTCKEKNGSPVWRSVGIFRYRSSYNK